MYAGSWMLEARLTWAARARLQASSSAGLRSVVSDASTGVVKAASETKSDKLPAVKGAAPDVRAIASTPALDVGAAERAAKVVRAAAYALPSPTIYRTTSDPQHQNRGGGG